MKKYLILISLFTTITLFSQNSFPQSVKNGTKISQHNDEDTIKIKLDNQSISIDQKPNQNVKFVLMHEESPFDFLKYIFPIITLMLGIVINKVIERYNTSRGVKKTGMRWIAELHSMEQPINEQIKSLDVFADELDTSEFKIPTLYTYSILNGESFKSLDKNDLLKYIESKNSKTDFKELVKISNRIHGYINIISSLYLTLIEKYKDFNLETSKHTNTLSKSLQDFNRTFAEYGIEIENEIEADPTTDLRYEPIAELYKKYIIPNIQSGNFNPYELGEDFFKPTLYILAEFRHDQKIKPLTNRISACLNDIKALKLEKEYMISNAKKISSLLSIEILRLDEIIKSIDVVN